jgi:etoposide-induced 2.4 mRNA
MTSIIVTLCKFLLIGPFLAGIVEVFLYSILHAYYCFEYKAAILDLDFLSGLLYFEAQWAYQCGFGFIFTMVLYLFKQVGSSLFFLFFPIMVVISLEEDGQSLLAYREDRVTKSLQLPVVTMAYYPHRWILRKINSYISNAEESA